MGDVVVSPYLDEGGKPLNADHWNSKEVIAYFYNHAKNSDEVVTNDRWGIDTDKDAVRSKKSFSGSLWSQYAKAWHVDSGALLGDFQTPERRNITTIFKTPWETCDALDPTSWGYNKRTADDQYMTTNQLIDYLADIVSKGGNLLINIGPRADGTIPEVMEDRLKGAGTWLSVNGDAIYGTRPWLQFGEGSTTEELGAWNEKGYQFKAGDVRYTRKGNMLYVILLEWPGNEISLNSLKNLHIRNMSMLGSSIEMKWTLTADSLKIFLPSGPVSPYANTIRIECKEKSLD